MAVSAPSSSPGRTVPPSNSWGRTTTSDVEGSSLGLSTRQGALLAYSAGWISGLLVLMFETRNRVVRAHAAQSLVLFGALTLIGLVLLVLAGVGLLQSLTLFRVSLVASQVLIACGVVVWIVALVGVVIGRPVRWPVVRARVDRLAGPPP